MSRPTLLQSDTSSIARGPRRVLLALALVGLGGLTARGPAELDVLVAVGLALLVLFGSTVEGSRWMAGLWTVGSMAVWVAGSVPAEPGWTPVRLATLAGVPLALAALGWQGWSMTRSVDGALKTSEVARAKLRRSNGELGEAMARQRAALERLSTVVANLADGLVVVTAEGAVELTNAALSELLEGQVTELGALPEPLRVLVARCLESSEPGREELALPGDRIGLAAAAPLDLGKGERGVVVLVRDVTLDKEIERMKSNFAATVSHEMRTPMTSVLGFARVIGNQLENKVFPGLADDDAKAWRAAEKVRRNLDILIHEGERMIGLITDVLDLSLLDAGQMAFLFQDCDPAELVGLAVEEVRGRLPEGRQIRIDVGPLGGLPTVRADRRKIVTVLVRLLDNGVKFTEQGAVTVTAVAEGAHVVFTVRDEGVGIRPAHRERIFEPFHQLGDVLTDRPTGTGLGLPISRAIVLAHGGTIGVEGDTGSGAVFAFTLPRS